MYAFVCTRVCMCVWCVCACVYVVCMRMCYLTTHTYITRLIHTNDMTHPRTVPLQIPHARLISASLQHISIQHRST